MTLPMPCTTVYIPENFLKHWQILQNRTKQTVSKCLKFPGICSHYNYSTTVFRLTPDHSVTWPFRLKGYQILMPYVTPRLIGHMVTKGDRYSMYDTTYKLRGCVAVMYVQLTNASRSITNYFHSISAHTGVYILPIMYMQCTHTISNI